MRMKVRSNFLAFHQRIVQLSTKFLTLLLQKYKIAL